MEQEEEEELNTTIEPTDGRSLSLLLQPSVALPLAQKALFIA